MTNDAQLAPVIALDAGNTNIRVYICGGDAVSDPYVFPSDRGMTSADIEARLRSFPAIADGLFDGAVFCSVVKELDEALSGALSRITGCEAIRVSSSINTGFEIRYDPASSLGADRIANAAGAFASYPGENLLVVDAGTAVTFCVLLAERIFDGGLIVPGTGLAAKSLSMTSRLPVVGVDDAAPLVGRNTRDGIAGGILHGWAAMIDGLAARIEERYARPFRLVLTGGCAPILSPHIRRAHTADTALTVRGLLRLYDLNRG